MKLNMFKKLILSFLTSILLLVSILPLFSRPAYAQAWYQQEYNEWQSRVYNTANPEEIFGERYTAAQVEWVIYGLIAFIINHLGDAELNNCLLDPANADPIADCRIEIVAAFGNFFNITQNIDDNDALAAAFWERPVSSVAYFKDIASRLHIVPEAQAQGFGFGAANPILELWKVVRNITYFLLILVIITMAFMIMFRVRISPQTVITVQSSLPKIILALILITFSYAIAGFLIDLMYVIIGLLSAIFTTGPSPISDFSWSDMYAALTGGRSIFSLMLFYFLSFSIVLFSMMAPSNILGAIFAPFGYILAILVILIAFIILLIATFRILWLMLKTYVMIILNIIVGPIMILLGTVGPGGFGPWLRGIMAHLAVYPTVGFLFVLAFVFLRGALDPRIDGFFADFVMPFNVNQIVSPAGASWDPPLTVGTGSQDFLWLGVSFVIIMIIPQVANVIRGIIQQRPFAMGTAIGEAIGMPFGFALGSGPVRELREQASALGAYKAVQSIDRHVPESWRLKGSLWRAYKDRVERRGGFGGDER